MRAAGTQADAVIARTSCSAVGAVGAVGVVAIVVAVIIIALIIIIIIIIIITVIIIIANYITASWAFVQHRLRLLASADPLMLLPTPHCTPGVAHRRHVRH
jgi:hypothetical protein